MNYLIDLLARSGLFRRDLDYHLLRAAMVIIFVWNRGSLRRQRPKYASTSLMFFHKKGKDCKAFWAVSISTYGNTEVPRSPFEPSMLQ